MYIKFLSHKIWNLLLP